MIGSYVLLLNIYSERERGRLDHYTTRLEMHLTS